MSATTMPTNPSTVSVISGHLASCLSNNNPTPLQTSRITNKNNSSGNSNNCKSNVNCSVDIQLASRAKSALTSKIDFQRTDTTTSTAYNDALKAKYVNLSKMAATQGHSHQNGHHHHNHNHHHGSHSNHAHASSSNASNSNAVQKRVLYPPERIQLQWCRPVPVGVGLVNCGNTCFLNSTLQALTHTAPLYNYLVSEQHSQNCKLVGFCMLCEMERHMVQCYGTSTNRAIQPNGILQKLHIIAKHLRLGRQEDAHEFLRFAVEKMQQACLNGHQKLDAEVKETTAMNAIFGGSIKSTVICQVCLTRSDKIDPIMDLCLELKQCTTLQQALEHFIRPEVLVGDNAYKCPSCKKSQPARKTLCIQKAPNVLTFQLKRFGIGFSMFGGAKITKQIEFYERFDLRSFMSVKTGPPIFYSLYAVVVHEGMSANSGHYYAYVKHGQQWFVMNDTVVKTVSLRQVLGCQAYILFYIRDLETESSRPSGVGTIPSTKANPIYHKPTTIPSSPGASVSSSTYQPLRMVIRLNNQTNNNNNNTSPNKTTIITSKNSSTTPPTQNHPHQPTKITSYSAQPLIAKRPAQSTTTTTTTPVRQQNDGASSTAKSAPTTPAQVTASRPLVDGFDSSTSTDDDDDDDKNRLVIDEQAPPAASVSTKWSSPPTIKFMPPVPIGVSSATANQQRPMMKTDISASKTTTTTTQSLLNDNEPAEDEDTVLEDGEVEVGRKLKKREKSESDRKRRQQSADDAGLDDDESSSSSSRKKGKKRRKNKRRKQAGEEGEKTGQDAAGEGRHRHHHRHHHRHRRRRHSRSDSEQEEPGDVNEDDQDDNDDWVEKAVEKVAEPVDKTWTTPAVQNGSGFPLPPNLASYSLGSHVASWDGRLNSIDSQLLHETGNTANKNFNERWKRDFDDDLDAGRLKKTRKFNAKAEFDNSIDNGPALPPPFNNNASYGTGNPFQAVQTARNEQREMSSMRPSPHNRANYRNGVASNVSSPVVESSSQQPNLRNYPIFNNNGNKLNNNESPHVNHHQQQQLNSDCHGGGTRNFHHHHHHNGNIRKGTSNLSHQPQQQVYHHHQHQHHHPRPNNNNNRNAYSAPRPYGHNNNNNDKIGGYNNSNNNNSNGWRGGSNPGRDSFRRQYSFQ